MIPLEPLWAHYKRIIKPRGAIVLTASQPFTTVLIASNMAWFKYCWVWAKTKKTDFANAKNKPLKEHEDIPVFSPGTTANGSLRRMNYYPQGLVTANRSKAISHNKHGNLYGRRAKQEGLTYMQEFTNYPGSVLPIASAGDMDHPTQKPTALMEYLIRTYTNECELVLDNAMGSATTGIACIRTGRRFIGIEKDPDIFETARQRLSGGKPQVTVMGDATLKQARLFD